MHHYVEACDVGEAVVQRQYYEHHVVRRNGDDRGGLLHVRGVVAMGEQYALRVCRRSGGIADIGIVVRAYGFVAGHEFVALCGKEGVTELQYLPEADFVCGEILEFVEDHKLLHCREFVDYAAYLRELGFGNHHHLRVRVSDAEDKVRTLGEVDGERNVHSASVKYAQFAYYPGVAAFGKEGHLVALAETQGHQTCSYPVGLLPCLGECGFCPFPIDFFTEEGVGGMLCATALHELNDCNSFVHILLTIHEERVRRARRLSCRRPPGNPQGDSRI